MGEQQRRLIAADIAATDDAEADGDRLAGLDGRRRVDGHARARGGVAGRRLRRGGSRHGRSAATVTTPSAASRRTPGPRRTPNDRAARAQPGMMNAQAATAPRHARETARIPDARYGLSCLSCCLPPCYRRSRRRLLDALAPSWMRSHAGVFARARGEKVAGVTCCEQVFFGCPRPPTQVVVIPPKSLGSVLRKATRPAPARALPAPVSRHPIWHPAARALACLASRTGKWLVKTLRESRPLLELEILGYRGGLSANSVLPVIAASAARIASAVWASLSLQQGSLQWQLRDGRSQHRRATTPPRAVPASRRRRAARRAAGSTARAGAPRARRRATPAHARRARPRAPSWRSHAAPGDTTRTALLPSRSVICVIASAASLRSPASGSAAVRAGRGSRARHRRAGVPPGGGRCARAPRGPRSRAAPSRARGSPPSP